MEQVGSAGDSNRAVPFCSRGGRQPEAFRVLVREGSSQARSQVQGHQQERSLPRAAARARRTALEKKPKISRRKHAAKPPLRPWSECLGDGRKQMEGHGSTLRVSGLRRRPVLADPWSGFRPIRSRSSTCPSTDRTHSGRWWFPAPGCKAQWTRPPLSSARENRAGRATDPPWLESPVHWS